MHLGRLVSRLILDYLQGQECLCHQVDLDHHFVLVDRFVQVDLSLQGFLIDRLSPVVQMDQEVQLNQHNQAIL